MVDFEEVIKDVFTKQPARVPSKLSDFFIKKTYDNLENEETITNLKIQKLLYYSYVWYLVLNKKKLFQEEIEAWQFGPVIKSEYHRLKKYKNESIKRDAIENDLGMIPKHIQEFLNTIWNSYGRYTSTALVEMAHEETPWLKAYSEKKEKNKKIKDESIINFYKIEKAHLRLPENTVIREGDEGYELFVLNKSTQRAINFSEEELEDYTF